MSADNATDSDESDSDSDAKAVIPNESPPPPAPNFSGLRAHGHTAAGIHPQQKREIIPKNMSGDNIESSDTYDSSRESSEDEDTFSFIKRQRWDKLFHSLGAGGDESSGGGGGSGGAVSEHNSAHADTKSVVTTTDFITRDSAPGGGESCPNLCADTALAEAYTQIDELVDAMSECDMFLAFARIDRRRDALHGFAAVFV
jgi:hypothetical protein